VSVVNRTTNGICTIGDVKTTKKVYRLWKDGAAGKEYFPGRESPAEVVRPEAARRRLLVYHIDEAIDSNENEDHPFIKLLEADAKGHLHDGANRGDAGILIRGARRTSR
jgi:immune inhibitor A